MMLNDVSFFWKLYPSNHSNYLYKISSNHLHCEGTLTFLVPLIWLKLPWDTSLEILLLSKKEVEWNLIKLPRRLLENGCKFGVSEIGHLSLAVQVSTSHLQYKLGAGNAFPLSFHITVTNFFSYIIFIMLRFF
jgi:hypothetical protein